jgi:hypothetical protein
MMWTAAFWRGATERALKTVAQVLVLLLAGDGTNVLAVDWWTVGGAVGGAVLLSLATSVLSSASGIGPAGSPSLVDDQPVPESARYLRTNPPDVPTPTRTRWPEVR